MQINYLGGTQLIDYFSTTSWLNTLLYHESAHNYQINAKKSLVSQVGYQLFGNSAVVVPFLPIYFLIIPNVVESSFILEGNAVLNESWHNNGGRLYSGRFKALTYLQSQAGNIKPELMFNPTLEFPYGERFYIVGGFFQLFLAERFGLKTTNEYFYNYSVSWLWPFRTNYIFEQTFGISYEEAMKDFDKYLTKEREGFVMLKGEHLASSQVFYQLNSDEEEIFFLSNEDYISSATLEHFNKNSRRLTQESGSWLASKVIKKEGEYLTQSSANTNPTKIYQGLFGKNGFIEDNTSSKNIQAYLRDKTPVYFDVSSSYDQAQLYVGDSFYDRVNSSVFVDKEDNIYYFKQNAKERTLYKNREVLLSFEGYYGYVNDVDSKQNIYFVANSEKGSTLYRFNHSKIERVLDADNVIEARLIDDETLLVAAIGEDEYYYISTKMQIQEQKPYETKLFFEDKEYFGVSEPIKQKKIALDLNESYIAPLDLGFSSFTPSLGYSTTKGVQFNFSANFSDVLAQNSFSLFAQRGLDEVMLAGASYNNSRYILEYGINAYAILDAPDQNRTYQDLDGKLHTFGIENRKYGLSSYAKLPLIKMGYLRSNLKASYYMDYDSLSREPATLSLDISQTERFGRSMFSNFESSLLGYGVYDRADMIYGGSYNISHSLGAQFYAGIGIKYSKSNASVENNSALYDRGVKVSASQSSLIVDPSTIVMPALSQSFYTKEAGYIEGDIKKVFDFSSYFFTFPLSLRREVISTSYRRYLLESFSNNSIEVNEAELSITFETVLMNKLVLPLSIGVIYNDSVAEEYQVTFDLGFSF